MPATLAEIERRLWSSADQLRANSGLKASEYSVPVLGLIFLRFADVKFAQAHAALAASLPPCGTSLHRDHNAAKNVERLGQSLRADVALAAS